MAPRPVSIEVHRQTALPRPADLIREGGRERLRRSRSVPPLPGPLLQRRRGRGRRIEMPPKSSEDGCWPLAGRQSPNRVQCFRAPFIEAKHRAALRGRRS